MLQIACKSKARWSMGAVDFFGKWIKWLIYKENALMKGRGRSAPGRGGFPVGNFSAAFSSNFYPQDAMAQMLAYPSSYPGLAIFCPPVG